MFIGPPNSGKSARAECLMQDLASSQIAYIATLPQLDASQARIERHQARRGMEWKTWEMVDTGDESLRLIEAAMQLHRHVLLDGVSILVWRISVSAIDGEFDLLGATHFLHNLTTLLATSNADWIVVDSDYPYIHLGSDDPFNQLMREFHSKWIVLCNSVSV